jgi:hypothetical protein
MSHWPSSGVAAAEDAGAVGAGPVAGDSPGGPGRRRHADPAFAAAVRATVKMRRETTERREPERIGSRQADIA